MSLPEQTQRAVMLVRQQLRILHETWGPGATTQDVYALAGHLRSLLKDGAFSRAWGAVWPHHARPQATVVAPDLTTLISREFWSYIVHAQSAGIAAPGMHVWMPVVLGAMPPELSARLEHRRRRPTPGGDVGQQTPVTHVASRLRGGVPSGLVDQGAVPVEPPSCYRRFRLSKYLDSPCMIHNGRAISRVHLTAIFANKMGAAHVEWDKCDGDYQALTDSGRWLRLTGRNPALLEILSIGQTLVLSDAVKVFCDRVDELKLDSTLL